MGCFLTRQFAFNKILYKWDEWLLWHMVGHGKMRGGYKGLKKIQRKLWEWWICLLVQLWCISIKDTTKLHFKWLVMVYSYILTKMLEIHNTVLLDSKWEIFKILEKVNMFMIHSYKILIGFATSSEIYVIKSYKRWRFLPGYRSKM